MFKLKLLNYQKLWIFVRWIGLSLENFCNELKIFYFWSAFITNSLNSSKLIFPSPFSSTYANIALCCFSLNFSIWSFLFSLKNVFNSDASTLPLEKFEISQIKIYVKFLLLYNISTCCFCLIAWIFLELQLLILRSFFKYGLFLKKWK